VRSLIRFVALAGVTALAASSALAQITIPTVTIGSPGNAADPADGDSSTPGVQNFGAVAYTYNIGTYEITNAEYAAFLRAKAASDPFNLYNPAMAGPFGGITRSGLPGSYTYVAVRGRASHPVNYVSFWDACRFANWLHNGQGGGDTETGAYTLGGVANPVNASVTRNAGWKWAVTSEDEWYKAAHHQPWLEMGDIDDYWLYATSSNSMPTIGQANYGNVIGNTTPGGSYAPNYYGVFDMNGNVYEWNEAMPPSGAFGTNVFRGGRGGSYAEFGIDLRADNRGATYPESEGSNIGFRVSQKPPACPGDFNGDGFLDFTDFDLFAALFEAGDTSADFNGDGFIDFTDFDAFVAAFEAGC